MVVKCFGHLSGTKKTDRKVTVRHSSTLCLLFWLNHIYVLFASSAEDLVLEESPKWKLLADVLDEIERDDTKNESKRK